MTTTRVKVKRAAVIKIVEGRTRKAENEHKRAVAGYPGKVEAWEKSCIAHLEKALVNAKRGKIPTSRYGSPEVKFPGRPAKPREGRTLCNLRRMLATLKIGAEDTIWLSQEDADEYFGPCAL